MADFRLVSTLADTRTMTLEKASATVIEAGDMVTLDAGWLVIKAVEASTALAYTDTGAGAWETEITILADDRLVFEGTGDANFAKAQRGTEVDLVWTTTQLIDVGSSATDVFKIVPGVDAGTVGSTAKIRVTINKTIY